MGKILLLEKWDIKFDWWLRSRKKFERDLQDSSSPISTHVISTSIQLYLAARTKNATQLVVIKTTKKTGDSIISRNHVLYEGGRSNQDLYPHFSMITLMQLYYVTIK